MSVVRSRVEAFLLIGLGGFVGANVRYWVSSWVARQVAERTHAAFPLGTIIVNLSGSFLLAVFLAWAASRVGFPAHVRLLVATGFFGGYTTFSTYATESIALFQSGDWLGAVVNIVGTTVLSLLAVLLGLAVGSRLS